jgi:hypothetical protein
VVWVGYRLNWHMVLPLQGKVSLVIKLFYQPTAPSGAGSLAAGSGLTALKHALSTPLMGVRYGSTPRQTGGRLGGAIKDGA